MMIALFRLECWASTYYNAIKVYPNLLINDKVETNLQVHNEPHMIAFSTRNVTTHLTSYLHRSINVTI